MSFALDSAGNPDPWACVASGAEFMSRYARTPWQRYGVDGWYVEACHDAGLPLWMIFEEWGNQFLDGYDTGRALVARSVAGARGAGLEPGRDYLPGIALVDPSPSPVYGNEDALAAFAAGIDAECGDQGITEWAGYGSKYGLVDVVRARGVAPRMTRLWGVRTWGFTDSFEAGCDLIQEPNIYAPVNGTDYNSVINPNMRGWAWPRIVTPAPVPLPAEVAHMGAVKQFVYSGVPQVIWIDGDGNVRHSWWDPGPWDHHEILCGPGPVKTTPLATPAVPELGLDVEQHDGYINVCAVGRDGSLVHVGFAPGVGWTPYPVAGGGTFPTAQEAAASAIDATEIVTPKGDPKLDTSVNLTRKGLNAVSAAFRFRRRA